MPRTYSNDDNYMMYTYKVKLCSRTDSHSWKHCPWRHPGETAAQRRHPSMHRPVMCMNLRLAGDCADGDSCPFSHNAFELSLHPERYKTTLCNLGEKCNRDICFFAHSEKDVRTAEPAAPHPGGNQAAGSSAQAAAHLQPFGSVWQGSSSNSQSASFSGAGPSAAVMHSSGLTVQQQQRMVVYAMPKMVQQQQQQQPMLVHMPQSMRQGSPMPQLSQPQQQQQQVVVLQAPQFMNQPQGVWVPQQQLLQQILEPLPMQQAGMVPAAVPGGLPAHSGALAAAVHSADLSSTSYLSPGASGGSSTGFISRVYPGHGAAASSASDPMEQQLQQDQALLMRQDLCKFDSFTSQGAAPGSFSMRLAQQQVLLQHLQQQPPQQQQPVGHSVASLESYPGQMSLSGVQQQQEATMFGSLTSQGGSSGRAELPSGMQQQQYVLQRQDISNLDSFTSQCLTSAGSFSSSGHTYAPTQQSQQQQQVLFSAAYSDPLYYYDPGQAEGAGAVSIVGGPGQAVLPMGAPLPIAFETQGGAVLAGQPLVQLPGSVVQTPLPGYAATAGSGQGMVVLQQGGSAAEYGIVGAAAVGSSTGRHSLDMGAALGTVAAPQQQVAAQSQQQQQQQQQAGLVELQHFPHLQ